MSNNILTTEERELYDDLMYEAGYDENGKPRPSFEIGPRIVEMLRDAAYQAHQQWAGFVLDDLAEAGALTRWKQWQKQREFIEVRTDEGEEQPVVVTKPAAMSVRRRDVESGKSYFQMTMWDDMTRDHLLQVIQREGTSIQTSRETIATARRLLALLDRAPEATTVGEAAQVLGTDVGSYLGKPEERAA